MNYLIKLSAFLLLIFSFVFSTTIVSAAEEKVEDVTAVDADKTDVDKKKKKKKGEEEDEEPECE